MKIPCPNQHDEEIAIPEFHPRKRRPYTLAAINAAVEKSNAAQAEALSSVGQSTSSEEAVNVETLNVPNRCPSQERRWKNQ